MRRERSVQSAVDPEVHAVIRDSATPMSVDGYKLGEPTGLVVCEHCYRVARHWDWITHGRTSDGQRCPFFEDN